MKNNSDYYIIYKYKNEATIIFVSNGKRGSVQRLTNNLLKDVIGKAPIKFYGFSQLEVRKMILTAGKGKIVSLNEVNRTSKNNNNSKITNIPSGEYGVIKQLMMLDFPNFPNMNKRKKYKGR